MAVQWAHDALFYMRMGGWVVCVAGRMDLMSRACSFVVSAFWVTAWGCYETRKYSMTLVICVNSVLTATNVASR